MFKLNYSNLPRQRAKKEKKTIAAAAADNSLATTEVATTVADLAEQFIALSEQVAELAAASESK